MDDVKVYQANVDFQAADKQTAIRSVKTTIDFEKKAMPLYEFKKAAMKTIWELYEAMTAKECSEEYHVTVTIESDGEYVDSDEFDLPESKIE